MEKKIWWGNFDFKDIKIGHWKIGPLELMICKLTNEWRIYSNTSDNYLADYAEFKPLDAVIEEFGEVKRFAVSQTGSSLYFMPLLADRPIIARPETPFYVSPYDDVSIYISSPLWLRIVNDASKTKLIELPIYRPSDTWFGDSTIKGNFCYASKTHARIRLEDIPKRVYRAATAIKIKNKTSEPLLVERIKIPVPNLSLYVTEDVNFSTEPMVFTKETKEDMAKVELLRGPNYQSGAAKLLSEPRIPFEKNMVMRVFNSIF